MTIANLISAGFVALCFVLLLLIQFSESSALICYGKVAQGQTSHAKSLLARVINASAKITVPKSWFAHFYVLYSALMWGQLIFFPSYVLANGKYRLVWAFLTCQASRRLYESYWVTRWSTSSRMHVTHYSLGFVFYIGVAAACFCGLRDQTISSDFSIFNADWKSWAWVSILAVAFLNIQLDQNRNHSHLANLVKYSVPSKGLFSVVSSAHYLDEIMVYFTVALSVFTRGAHLFDADWAFLSVWVFVVTNLSISALETHHYYQKKFEDFKVPYAIIPGVI